MGPYPSNAESWHCLELSSTLGLADFPELLAPKAAVLRYTGGEGKGQRSDILSLLRPEVSGTHSKSQCVTNVTRSLLI